jgi:tripeptidyl-peptidase-1
MANLKVLIGLALVLLVAAWVEGRNIPSHVEVHEKIETLHRRWTKRDRVEGHKVFQMRVGLAQTGLDDGYDHLMDVCAPLSLPKIPFTN